MVHLSAQHWPEATPAKKTLEWLQDNTVDRPRVAQPKPRLKSHRTSDDGCSQMLLIQFEGAGEDLPGGVGYTARIHVCRARRDLPTKITI